MGRIVLAIVVVLVIMQLGAFVAYGAFSVFLELEPPQDIEPGRFFLSVLLMKLGLAIAFVLLFHMAREMWITRWATYALIWWIMFAVMEVGQAIGPHYSWMEATAGIIAESIYCPLSALATAKLLGKGLTRSSGLR